MQIKQIKIRGIGPHENTEINLGSKATIIFAENGIGKSLFANSFSEENNWVRGWNKESQIIFKGTRNSKGKLIFSNKNVEWQNKLSISNNVILYDDWIFNKTLKNHYKHQILLPSDSEQRNKSGLRWRLYDINQISKLNNIAKTLEKPPKKIVDGHDFLFKNHEAKKSNREFANKILKFYNRNYKDNKFLNYLKNHLNSRQIISLLMYLSCVQKKTNWSPIEIFGFLIILRSGWQGVHALFEEFEFKKIPVKDIDKIQNAFIWQDVFRANQVTQKMISAGYHNLNDDKVRNNKDSLIDLLKINVENQIKEIDNQIEKDKENRKNISIEMNKIIRTLPMHNKVTMDENLKPVNEKGKISLSSGEIKILDIILFVERNKNQEKIFLFDDPLTSADTNYIRIILTYLKKTLQDRQMIFLTHNEIVLNELRYGYRKQIHSKSKKENKKVLFYIWKINKYSKVHTSEFPINISDIEHAWRELNNHSNDCRLRIHYARKIFEHMSFVAVGHNNFSSIYDYESKEIIWFGKRVKCPIELWRDLNKYSHYNLYDWNLIKNGSYLDRQINKVISIIKQIGFDLKENSKPHKTEFSYT